MLDYEMVHKIPTVAELINVLEMVEGKMAKKKGKETIPKETSSKGICFHCGQDDHWKRNCKAYKESKKQVACDALTPSGIYVIEVNTISYGNLWVLDTGCGSHICTGMQGLRDNKKLTKGESDLRVGNGARVATVAIGTYVLNLPSGFCLYLDNCFCVPAFTKNIIYVSCLNKKRFHLNFCDNSCCIMLNDVFYAGGTLSNGIYILDMSNPILNINDSKRQKGDNLKSSYIWHCHLGHIIEIRMTKLHKCRSLGSFDYESFDTCESCLLGKMTKLPFKGKGERANGLLDLILTDVCGLMSVHARGGFVYFITFIDDYS